MATIYGWTCMCDEYYGWEGCYSETFKSEKMRDDHINRTGREYRTWEKYVTRDMDEWKEAK